MQAICFAECFWKSYHFVSKNGKENDNGMELQEHMHDKKKFFLILHHFIFCTTDIQS
jgi:hypothetical protein